jgi:hypothetical protein
LLETARPRIWQPPAKNEDIPHHSGMHWRSELPFFGFGPLREQPFEVRRTCSSKDEIEAPVRALIDAEPPRNRDVTAAALPDAKASCAATDTPQASRANTLLQLQYGRSTDHGACRRHGPFFWVANEAVGRRQWSRIRGNQ